MRKSNFLLHVEREFEILEKDYPNADILPYKKEIVNLMKRFSKEGHSGMSAQIASLQLQSTINKLCDYRPLTPILDQDDDWIDVSVEFGCETYMHKRCGNVFKDSVSSHYTHAIVWLEDDRDEVFSGTIYRDDINFDTVSSSQRIDFPFTPRTFYIDVIRKNISIEDAEAKGIDVIQETNGDTYYYVVKNPNELEEEVFEYYTKG